MEKAKDFLDRIKINKIKHSDKETIDSGIELHIQGDMKFSQDDKEDIIEGAKLLLEVGNAKSIEDAIISFASTFRGLKCIRSKIENGKTIITLSKQPQKIDEKSL